MQSTPEIIELLNDVLTAELTAINQYFVHAKMQDNWGYKRLAEKGREESFGEMKHAEELIERILYLEGVPNMQRLFNVKVGENVPEQLQAELATEKDAITRLAAGIEQCRKTDEGSRVQPGQGGRQGGPRPEGRELDGLAAVVAQQGGQRDVEADTGSALPDRPLGLGPPDGQGDEHAVRYQPGDRRPRHPPHPVVDGRQAHEGGGGEGGGEGTTPLEQVEEGRRGGGIPAPRPALAPPP